MQTLRLNGKEHGDVERAAELLRSGRTVAFPTETVYGLGANALDAAAVAGIFAAKQRPAWDPLIVHISASKAVSRVAEVSGELEPRIRSLAEKFWPGPLTLLLPRRTSVPDAVTAGRALVGVRVPAHAVALQLLTMAGVPVAAPSANVFGHVSPTTAQHVLADLDGRIDAVLDGGATAVGVESTVLDPEAMVIYRPGAVTAEAIEHACGYRPSMYEAPAHRTQAESLPSPGVGIKHYAPRAQVVLVGGSESEMSGIARAGDGLMLPSGWSVNRADLVSYDWGAWNSPDMLAARLFAGLRELDARGVKRILCPLPEDAGIGKALRDRLFKAARK